eukprot:CAMPEP_0204038320 /NCGR_PEP_ID=MMETSP0360-20130528/86941_1 /ASSEMBLY_ACC=CAM_ASM_000342 /TAXON_ID=268821 /ORGANISM="Scrippsiella Hangoei, Strain SHTV-5" /LENGTH=79 /DNA_ID=CAMNT_0050983971 /DNA_START=17 /DNA_END=253 /DNA_ORIENTATION=-
MRPRAAERARRCVFTRVSAGGAEGRRGADWARAYSVRRTSMCRLRETARMPLASSSKARVSQTEAILTSSAAGKRMGWD